ncbi:hypothetical protein CCACVL1_26219 [Corchorus capsularis]|uniref:F-box domain-containing protein n=2 Tax=Corchorus capsularis TaxID=210143 RepID=A0A1R3GFJ7_COCAP|nr:hypothetical protein CCACVL1_26219 [Corchorus capsularis]
MELQCLSWILHIWSELVSTRWIEFQIDNLPGDLIVEILSRLPAEEVLKCRRVCKKWRTLTSTRHFTHKHVKNNASDPIFVLQYGFLEGELELYYLDEELNWMIQKNILREKRVCTSFMDHTLNDWPMLVDSYDGLLLFHAFKTSNIFICNPITQEVITLKPPPTPRFARQGGGDLDDGLIGIFFHSSTKEYRLLYIITHKNSSYHEYFILSLGSKIWRSLGTFTHRTTLFASVISNNSLHWLVPRGSAPCSESILVFNPDLETFKVLPHPGSQCCSKLCENYMVLNRTDQMDGLSLSMIYDKAIGSSMVIWELKDHQKWGWSKTYLINLDFMNKIDDGLFFRFEQYIGNIQNNEIVLMGRKRGVYLYNLFTKAI